MRHVPMPHPCGRCACKPAVLPVCPASCRNGCARNGAQSARWKPAPEYALGSEAEGNCVAARRGGEQPEASGQAGGHPKGDGQTRPLGIPTVKDRVVQTAVKRVLEPIFEFQFLATRYGLLAPSLGLALRASLRLSNTASGRTSSKGWNAGRPPEAPRKAR